MHEERHQAWLKFQTHKTEENTTNLKNIRKEFTQSIRKIKRQYQKHLINSIEENYYKTNSRDYYKAFGKQLQKYSPLTLLLKNKDGK